MNLYYQNVRGLRTKTKDLLLGTQGCIHDVIILTESWLKDSVYDSEFKSDEYVAYRRDRDSKTSHKKDGGGVLVLVKKSSVKTSVQQIDWQTDTIEDLWVSLTIGHSKIHLCAVYVSPYSKVENLTALKRKILEVQSRCPNDTFIIAGDFNAPNFHNFDPGNFLGNETRNSVLKSIELSADLQQLNEITNHKGTILDLIFSSKYFAVTTTDQFLINVDNYHPPLIGMVPITKGPESHTNEKKTHQKFQKD
jgi:hypothetical protein